MPIVISIISNDESKLFDSKEIVDSRASNSSEDSKASFYMQSDTQSDKSLPPRNPTPRRRSKVNKLQGRTLATNSNPTPRRIATNSNPTPRRIATNSNPTPWTIAITCQQVKIIFWVAFSSPLCCILQETKQVGTWYML